MNTFMYSLSKQLLYKLLWRSLKHTPLPETTNPQMPDTCPRTSSKPSETSLKYRKYHSTHTQTGPMENMHETWIISTNQNPECKPSLQQFHISTQNWIRAACTSNLTLLTPLFTYCNKKSLFESQALQKKKYELS